MTDVELLRSPLDVSRGYIEDVAALDEMVFGLLSEEVAINYEELVALMADMGNSFPLSGRMVKASGLVLAHAISENGTPVLGEPQIQNEPITGVYIGISLRRFCTEEGETYHRIAHIIQEGEESYYDSLGNSIHKANNTFVCAVNAKIEPVEYVATHSLTDLEQVGGILTAIDEVAFLEDMRMVDKIHILGKIASSFFARYKNPEIRRQVVSYMNALDVFGTGNRRILTADYVVAGSDFTERLLGVPC